MNATLKTLTLSEVRDQVHADDSGKWDTTAARADIVLREGQVTFPLDHDGEHWERLTPTPWALGQLSTRLGIPAAYFRKCPPILQDVQANYWLKQPGHPPVAQLRADRSNGNGYGVTDYGATEANGNGYGMAPDTQEETPADGRSREEQWLPEQRQHEQWQHEQWLLRARYGTLRAVLSNRYSPLDNATLLDCLEPLLKTGLRVDWFALGDKSLHLRLVDPQRTREVLPDDALSVGIHVSNSEVGLRSVTLDALVYRLVCANGLIRLVRGKSLLRRRHIHLAQPRFIAAMEEAVENALVTADDFIEQLRLTTRQPVPDVEGTLQRLSEHWHLSEETRQAVQGALRQERAGQQETIYGLVNAVTSAAQRLPDEARYDLEVLAGHLAGQGLSGIAAYAPRRVDRRDTASHRRDAASQANRLSHHSPAGKTPTIHTQAADINGEDAGGKDTAGESTASKDTAGEDTAGEDTAGEDTVGVGHAGGSDYESGHNTVESGSAESEAWSAIPLAQELCEAEMVNLEVIPS